MRATLKERFVPFPNLSGVGEYRMNFDAGLNTSLTKTFGWHITASDRYISNPLTGLKKNDLRLTTGVNVRLGK